MAKEQKNKAEETEQKDALAVPEFMKKFLNQSKDDADSLVTSSMSVPRISYRGKRFRFIENGEEDLVKELSIKVVILGVEPGAGLFLKTYYDTGYQPGSTDPPTCSSSDGLQPDIWVSDPQADLCRSCKQNVFGSAVSIKGGKAKACKDGKRLWVARTDDLNKYYGLNIPVMSLKNLAEYGKFVSKNNYPLSLLITEIGLDDDSEFPQLVFSHAGFVEESMVETVQKINLERPWALPESMRKPQNQKQIVGASSPVSHTMVANTPEHTETMKKQLNEILDQW
jgi:hypothetical protein